MKEYLKPSLVINQIALDDVVLSSGGNINLIEDVFGWEGETERW